MGLAAQPLLLEVLETPGNAGGIGEDHLDMASVGCAYRHYTPSPEFTGPATLVEISLTEISD